MLSEIVVTNASHSGAARRVLNGLEMPESTMLLDTKRSQVQIRRRSSLFGGPGVGGRSQVTPIGGTLIPTREDWLSAMIRGSTTGADLEAWTKKVCEDEFNALNDDGSNWQRLETELPSVEAEWRHIPSTKLRQHRFSMVVEGVDAQEAFDASFNSIGTSSSFMFGDRSTLDQRVVARLHPTNLILMSSNRMGFGLSNRCFCVATTKHEAERIISNVSIQGVNLKGVIPEINQGFVLGHIHNFSISFQPLQDGSCKISALFCIDPRGSIPALVSLSFTGALSVSVL